MLCRMDPPAEPVETENTRPNSSRAGSRNSVKFPTSKPLPPIGAQGDILPQDDSDSDTDSDLTDDDMENKEDDTRSTKSNLSRVSSASLDKPGSGRARPAIVRGFRRESNMSGDRDSDDERSSRRSVTFSGDKSLSAKETSKRVTYDGKEITFITLNTQTDWEWYQDPGEEAKVLTGRSSILSEDGRERIGSPQGRADEEEVEKEATPIQEDFGIPQLNISDSDTDSSSDEDSYRRHEDYNYIPSIGPPNILQYNRESEKKELNVADPELQLDEEADDFPKDDHGLQYGIFGGVCEFCGHDIQPFPTLEQQMRLPPDQLFCCDQYREFFEFATTTAFNMAEEEKKKNKMINIKAHGPFSDKKAKKAAQERAEKRMKDREMARRQQEVTGLATQSNFMASPAVARGRPLQPPAPIAKRKIFSQERSNISRSMSNLVAQQVDLDLDDHYEVARQVKTIKYQLSSQMCLNEGWTIRPPSPVLQDDDTDVFVPEPLDHAMIADGKWRERLMIEKFYDDGQKFVTLFPDGTGNVFYPSGNLAILVSSIKLGHYHYVLHDDQPVPKTLATFDPLGYGSCYHENGNVRLYIDQFGGLESDPTGAKKKKWSWKDQETHVHAPPFQPICFGLSRHLAIRVMGQENIAVTFSAKQRSCRFNVGTKLKMVAPENIPPKEIDDNVIFLNENKIKVETLLDKVSTLLKFPKSPKIDKILPPLHITSKSLKTERMKKERQEQITAQQNKKPGKPIVVVS